MKAIIARWKDKAVRAVVPSADTDVLAIGKRILKRNKTEKTELIMELFLSNIFQNNYNQNPEVVFQSGKSTFTVSFTALKEPERFEGKDKG